MYHDLLRRQSIVSMILTMCELLWLKNLLIEFDFKPKRPITIYYGNQSAIFIAQNLMFHDRTKYMQVYCHLV